MVFCELGLIQEFVEEILPRIDCEIVLITGKWCIPVIEDYRYSEELLRSPKISHWFSHNQIIDHPKCHVFPYGVHFESANTLVNKMKNKASKKNNEIYYPYVSTCENITGEPLLDRKSLSGVMDSHIPLGEYYDKMNRCRYVASPKGDRPDTYRHWESIAMGCIPISNLTGRYKDLFGKNMIYLDKMEDVLNLNIDDLEYVRPNPKIATMPYWRKRIYDITKNTYASADSYHPTNAGQHLL